MIRALIFDCFGVLYNEGKAHLMSLCPPDKIDELRSLYYQSDYGFISREEFVTAVAELIGLSVDEYVRREGGEYVRNEPLFEFIRSKKSHYKTGILSNVGEEFLGSLISPIEQSELFDEVVLSSSVGMIKPAKEIYELMATRLELAPEECVFIDDIPSNVDGAKLAGMKSVLYTTNHQLEVDLRDILEQV